MGKDMLSVVIPTRERPDTLRHCLRTVLSQQDDRMEVVVSDNCSGPETRAVVESFNDSRIRYVRPESRLGMSENFEFALGHIKGSWVTVVGDDDGLMPSAVSRFFDLVKGRNVRSVASLMGSFEWPDPQRPGSGRLLCLSRKRGARAEVMNGRKRLEHVMLRGAPYKNLPCLYTGGFMRADLIDEVRRKSSGIFYGSRIPDVYSGVVVCSVDKEFLYSWEPLAIGGVSHHSNGIQWIKRGVDDARKSDFIKESGKQFHPSLGAGLIQILSLFVYESYLQSAHLRGFEVDTSMREQLALAMLTAPPERKDDTVAYCRELCTLNGIPHDEVLALLPAIEKRLRSSALVEKIRKISPFSPSVRKRVITNDESLENIYDASLRLGKMLGIS